MLYCRNYQSLYSPQLKTQPIEGGGGIYPNLQYLNHLLFSNSLLATHSFYKKKFNLLSYYRRLLFLYWIYVLVTFLCRYSSGKRHSKA